MQWKVFAVGAVLAVVGAGGLVREEIRAAAVEREAFADQHQLNMSRLLPDSPQQWLRIVHDAVARPDPDAACAMLAGPVREVFAGAHDAPDCVVAMTQLGGQVRNVNSYSHPLYNYREVITVVGEDRASLDACRVYWRDGVQAAAEPPGPLLGRFELRRVLPGGEGGYQAVGWRPCPPAGSATSVPPGAKPGPTGSAEASAEPTAGSTPAPPGTSSGRRLLPSYPPAYPGVILSAVARRDTAVCVFFTEAGQAQFAGALGVGTCAEAVNALADKVTDPGVYGDPQAGSVRATTIGGGRQSSVDACRLAWRSLGGSSAPGPQLGHLELVIQPAGGPGYLVAGFRPC